MEAAYRRVCCCEYDVRERYTVHHFTRAGVRFIVIGNPGVRFNFSYVASEAFVVSCFNEVVGVTEEVFVCVVRVSEGVN